MNPETPRLVLKGVLMPEPPFPAPYTLHPNTPDRKPNPSTPNQVFKGILMSEPGFFQDTSKFASLFIHEVRPHTLNPQPSTLNPQPSTLNPQPNTLNPQPSTINPTPSTLNPKP